MVSKEAVPMTAILGDLSGGFEDSLLGNFALTAGFAHRLGFALLGKSKPSWRLLLAVFV
jgi:hypothetical protein